MSDLPLVSLGQGVFRRDLHAADLADRGLVASIGAAVLSEPSDAYHAKASRFLSSHALGELEERREPHRAAAVHDGLRRGRRARVGPPTFFPSPLT